MSTLRSPWIPGVVIPVCLLGGLLAFVRGAPLWQVLLLSVVLPVLILMIFQLAGTKLLRRYRLLLTIVVLTLVLGVFEAWQHRKIPDKLLKALDISTGPGEPDLFLDYDLPEILWRLYPERGESLFVRGFQVKLCYDDQQAGRPLPAVCNQMTGIELRRVRKLFEMALQRKPKTEENVYYHYVEILMRLEASQSEIDAAASSWKQLFPESRRPDPRVYFR